jgi:type II secretory ATPase GspE/PulE/Tfp pilus assembly ATPase PilB-like protein
MAQRLVRRLCEHCRVSTPLDGTQKKIVDALLVNIPHPEDLPANRDVMWTPKGCEQCNGLGYKGRVAIVEAILMDEKIEKIVEETSSEREIWAAAAHQGIRSMAQDGIVKVLKGVTSLEELSRVVELEEHTTV